jgi:hypothetical protein
MQNLIEGFTTDRKEQEKSLESTFNSNLSKIKIPQANDLKFELELRPNLIVTEHSVQKEI